MLLTEGGYNPIIIILIIGTVIFLYWFYRRYIRFYGFDESFEKYYDK